MSFEDMARQQAESDARAHVAQGAAAQAFARLPKLPDEDSKPERQFDPALGVSVMDQA
jgi:hypothetical protein